MKKKINIVNLDCSGWYQTLTLSQSSADWECPLLQPNTSPWWYSDRPSVLNKTAVYFTPPSLSTPTAPPPHPKPSPWPIANWLLDQDGIIYSSIPPPLPTIHIPCMTTTPHVYWTPNPFPFFLVLDAGPLWHFRVGDCLLSCVDSGNWVGWVGLRGKGRGGGIAWPSWRYHCIACGHMWNGWWLGRGGARGGGSTCHWWGGSGRSEKNTDQLPVMSMTKQAKLIITKSEVTQTDTDSVWQHSDIDKPV